MIVWFEWHYIGGLIGVIIGLLWILKRRHPEWPFARKIVFILISLISSYIGMVIGMSLVILFRG